MLMLRNCFSPVSPCYLVCKTQVEANVLGRDGSMTKLTAFCYDSAADGIPSVLWLEDISLSFLFLFIRSMQMSFKRTSFFQLDERNRGRLRGKKLYCVGCLPFIPSHPLPTLLFAPGGSSEWIWTASKNPSCFLVSD